MHKWTIIDIKHIYCTSKAKNDNKKTFTFSTVLALKGGNIQNSAIPSENKKNHSLLYKVTQYGLFMKWLPFKGLGSIAKVLKFTR